MSLFSVSTIVEKLRVEENGNMTVFWNSLFVLVITLIIFSWKKIGSNKRSTLPFKGGYYRLPHVGTWIPIIGSAAFSTKGPIHEFILQLATKVNVGNIDNKNEQAPAFTTMWMGRKCAFITNSTYIDYLLRLEEGSSNYTCLDATSHQRDILRNIMAFNDDEINALFPDEGSTSTTVASISQKHLLQTSSLRELLHEMQRLFAKEVRALLALEHHSGRTRHSLSMFLSTAVFRVTVETLFSRNMSAHQVEHLEDLSKLEANLGSFLAGVPNFLISKGVQGRGGIISLFLSDLVVLSESPLLQQRRRFFTDLLKRKIPNSSEKETDFFIARNNMGLMLSTITNSIQSIFWTLLHLMADSKAYLACTQQIDAVVEKRKQKRKEDNVLSSFFTMDELDELTMLDSAFQETLRMYQTQFIRRHVVKDFCLNPNEKGTKYLLEKGTTCVFVPSIRHYDSNIFQNPKEFQFDRSLQDNHDDNDDNDVNDEDIISSPRLNHSLIFGNGRSACPGRKLMSYEARALLATLLWEFDLQLPGTDTTPKEMSSSGRRHRHRPSHNHPDFPRIDYSRQGFSMALPDRDIDFEARKRNKQK